jgi:hypothetical protein
MVASSLVAGSAVTSPGSAQASPDTLRLAIEDITFGAADVLASPVTGGIATSENLESVSDNGFLQGLYALPGWLGLTFLQATQGTLRIVVGVIEVIPGIVLFPFPDTDVPESFNVFRSGEALVDARNPLAENPAWLAWVPLITPITIDARIAPISPWARYVSPDDDIDSASLPSSSSSMASAP